MTALASTTPARHTIPTLRVLAALRAAGESGLYGTELMQACGLKSGTVYPMLDRLFDRGLIVERRVGRCGYVHLTEDGRRALLDGVRWVWRERNRSLARAREMTTVLVELGAVPGEAAESGAAG